MTKASDNAFPSLLITEGTEPSAPAAGKQRLYIDSTTHQLKRTDSSGVDVTVEATTAMATDTLWDAAGDLAVGTGANTAAKLTMGAAGGHVSRINGAVAWNSGTGFPSAATGDRYWRTDRGLEYYYDGTRWLSTTLYALHFSLTTTAGLSTTNNVYALAMSWADKYDQYLVDMIAGTTVGTTNNGSHYWTVRLYKSQTSGGSDTNLVSFNTSADTADVNTQHTTAANALLGTDATSLYLFALKTGSPGTLYNAGVTVTYRLVG